MPKTILITGANRGLGLEFTKQYLDSGYNVFATSRNLNTADDLQNLTNKYSNLTIYQLDVTNLDSIKSLKAQISNQPIDILLNNAGIYGLRDQDIDTVDLENLKSTMLTNAFAPVMLTQALLTNVKSSEMKTIANITSKMGSIGDNTSGGSYAYRASKAALNAIMQSMKIDLKKDGVNVLLIHPGWVKTDMGGQSADLTPRQSVSAIIKLIANAGDLDGSFYRYNGDKIPW